MTLSNKAISWGAVLLIVPIIISCASARVITVEPGVGGQIAVMPPHSEEARQKAMAYMAENCGSLQPKIVKEGEEIVGQVSHQQTTADTVFGQPALNSTGTTSNQTEWRITYKCVAPTNSDVPAAAIKTRSKKKK